MEDPTMEKFADELKESGIIVESNIPGSQLTTYRIGGPISYIVRLKNDGDCEVLANTISVGFKGLLNVRNTCVVGNGSNLLIDDDGFEGVVFLLEDELSQVGNIESGHGDQLRVSAGAGLSLPMFARQIAKRGFGGLEFYVGIPGTIGGAVAMNAGGHGKQTRDVLDSVSSIDLTTGHRSKYDNSQCEFKYRSSRFSRTDMVVTATFKGQVQAPENIKASLDEIVSWRRENQPGGRNVGSVFQNPQDTSAGSLIEKCGLKGFTIGGATVSEKHANFIQAQPDAKAKDVRDVISHVQKTVFQSTGYELKTEVRYITSHE